MDLLIDTYGTFIGATGERIALKFPKIKKRKEYAARRLKKILILRPSSISMHAVRLAIEHDIDIVYLGAFGKPIGRIFTSEPKGLAMLRRAQLAVSTDPARSFELAKQLVAAKCQNQISYLEQLANRRFDKEIVQAETVLGTVSSIPVTEKGGEQLLGIEGYVADKYWSSLRKLHKFPGRMPLGRDKFNSALNYGYGILYNEVERACLYVGLDPYIGLFHSERYGKPALVLDLVEESRVPVVDTAIIPLFLSKKLNRKDFECVKKGEYRLSPSGKAKVVEAVFQKLLQIIPWKGKRRTIQDIIQEQSRSLARVFLGKDKIYTPMDIKALS